MATITPIRRAPQGAPGLLGDDVDHVTECSNKTDWLAARRHGLGASDAPIVLGLSPWKSPLQLYCEKLELLAPSESESEAATWGTLLEPVIREEFTRRTGCRVLYPSPYRILRSRAHPWMTATLDGTLPDGGPMGPGVLEIKTASAFKREDWDKEPPLGYQVQIQHAMYVAEVSWGVLVVLLGGQQLKLFDVARNDDFLAALIPHLEAFWVRLQAEDPPADGRPVPAEVLKALYPRETPGKAVPLPAPAAEWDVELERAKRQIKKWDAIKQTRESQIKAALGDAERGVLPGGVAYTWKASERAAYTVNATTVRTLRRHEEKLT